MKKQFLLTLVLIMATLVAACEGDSRPFSEAVEIRSLNIRSINVIPPENAGEQIFLNRNERLQFSLQGINGVGNAVALDRNNRDWQVDNPDRATVTGDGLLTAAEDGEVNVFVSIGGIRSANFSVTVSDANLVAVESISGPTSLQACVPGQYFATGLFSDDTQRTLNDVTFNFQDESSENITVRNSISELATVTGFVPGDYDLTAVKDTITSDPFSINVPDSLTSITVQPTTATVEVGSTLDLLAQGSYTSEVDGSSVSSTTNITESVLWQVQTSNGAVDISNQSGSRGTVTGRAVGSAFAFASCGPVESPTSALTVTAATSSDIVFNFTEGILNMLTTDDTFELRVSTGTTYRSSNDISDDLVWSFEASAGISAPIRLVSDGDNAGNITPLSAGTALVRATRNSDSASITLTVVVRDP